MPVHAFPTQHIPGVNQDRCTDVGTMIEKGDQTFVIDGETKVENVLQQASKESGSAISVSAFGLFVLGEGIEKKKEDFAAEVAAIGK